MRFTALKCSQFRNLVSATIPLSAKQVLLVGENGQGKTNFLEALYVLCYGSSFRTPNLKDLVRSGCDAFKLTGTWEDDDGVVHELSCLLKQGKRTIKIDGKQITDRKQLVYTIPCIVFSHDDISFVSGEPEQRRRFFDQTMSMYDSMFLDALRHYRLALKQRNQAIKDQQLDLLPIYDAQLAKYGLQIQNERKSAIVEFDRVFGELYRKVSGLDWDIHISYSPSWKDLDDESKIQQVLADELDRDLVMQTTTSGVHRDRFVVKVGGKLLVDIGSTGQVRLASLLFRVAQMQFFRKKTGKQPVILLDDVLLELDHEKRARFLDVIDSYAQAFYTFLPVEQYFGTLQGHDALIYDVKEGAFTVHERP